MRNFNGKSSIKSILPALLPGLGYEQLELSSGGSINSIFNSYVNQPDDPKIINILTEYSKMDTYAMFLIYSKLTNFLDSVRITSLFSIESGIIISFNSS